MDIFLRFKDKKHAEAYSWDIELQIHRRIVMSGIACAITTFIYGIMYLFMPRVGSRTSQLLLAIRLLLLALHLLGLHWVKKNIHRLKPQVSNLLNLLDLEGCASNFVIYPISGNITVDNFSKLGVYVWAWCAAFCAFCIYLVLFSWWVKVLNMLAQLVFFFYFVMEKEPMYAPIFTFALIGITSFVFLSYSMEMYKKIDFLEKRKIDENYEAIKRIFDDICQGIVIVDTKFSTIYANRTVELMFNRQSPQKANHQSPKKALAIEELFAELEVKTIIPAMVSLSREGILPSQENIPKFFLNGMLGRIKGSLFHPETPEAAITAETYWGDPDNLKNQRHFSIKFTNSLFMDKQVIVINITDTTDRDSLIAAEASSEYKTRMMSSVSHELRTPLNGSINFIEQAITENAVPATVKEKLLTPALRSNRLLLSLVNDILDFSQMHAGKLRLVFESKSIVETAKECIELLEIQAQKKRIKLHLQNNLGKLGDTLMTDHNRLKQVILNLLSNAVKFTFQGGVTLTLEETVMSCPQISSSSYDGPITRLRGVKVTCKDTGIGISSENQKKLFQTFEKLDLGKHDLKINATGAGLGLVISNNIVQRLSPDDLTGKEAEIIRFKSKENEGSSFWFNVYDRDSRSSISTTTKSNLQSIHENGSSATISFIDMGLGFKNTVELMRTMSIKQNTPRTGYNESPRTTRILATLTNSVNTDDWQYSPRNYCECPKILIVDDDPFNLTALDQILAKIDITCTWAFNGKEALEKIEARQRNRCCSTCQQYKVVFLDCQMPVLDGFETAKLLKKKVKKGEIDDIKVIACTAFVQKSDEVKAKEAGMNDFCTKPINFIAIKEKLSKIGFI